MGRFDDLIGETEDFDAPVDNKQSLGGTYQCQTCLRVAHSATYIPENGELVWKCEDGHVSKIVGFYV